MPVLSLLTVSSWGASGTWVWEGKGHTGRDEKHFLSLSHLGAEAPLFCGASKQGWAPQWGERGGVPAGGRFPLLRRSLSARLVKVIQVVVPGAWTPVLVALGAGGGPRQFSQTRLCRTLFRN